MTVKWIGKRMMLGILVLLIVSFLSFFIMNAGPGSSATAYYGGNAQTLTASEKERISKEFGLDRPLIMQYGSWLKETLKGNLGMSAKEGRPVTSILGERLPNTLLLFGVSMFFIILGSVWLGMAAGMKPGSLLDRGLSTFSIASSSIPPFWLGILFIYLFSVMLGILPSSGTRSLSGEGGFVDKLRHLIMPASVVVLTHVGLYARFLQESVKSEIGSYYVMAAKANGVEEREIRRGVLRNAFIPYLNYLGMTVPSFFGGSVIVEALFAWSGLGQLLVKSVMVKDYPLLMGGIMLTGLIVIVTLLIIDVLMYMLDPKLRRGELGG
ncbi:ABC transporter permease [Sporosarcina highlanderae]|uniref:ABC transporter permease n=1 Tax=Sporosarcina highlanderae TaxID=3035916 RepID=A0ABT8JNC8_9BACL|nr:ABC transporter permease [Sporosarcina highlanderae]MDN4606655.1 ABC transporter permease [Sporosarcina highlanderae]